MNTGHLYVISAPSGTGKTSLVKALIEKDPSIRLSVSTTTREPRASEVNGKDYFFVKKEDFDKQINNNEFLEWAYVFGNFYGTSATLVKNSINRGEKVLLEIDWQGAFQIKKRYSRASLTLIFVAPPSLEILKERLQKRGQDKVSVIAERLAAAKEEMAKSDNFDYVIINDNFDTAVSELYTIINSAQKGGS
ncbi:guanylate kinase [Betaproteobacteria bacterium]|nr:guanylate kinase [Betaproteobacteria bacterium]